MRKILKSNRDTEIKNILIQYNSTNLKSAENNRRVPYKKEGWKKIYPYEKEIFVKNYGSTLTINLIVFDNQEVYQGEINYNNQKHGFGISILKNGCKFTGFWWENSFEGWGEYIDSDGNIFQGLFIKGKLNGKGEKFSLNGNHYQGDFVGGLRCGDGREETKEHIYEGKFENDKKNHKGKLTYKNIKDTFEGNFLDNNITGKGEYCWDNGDIFVGDFVNGKMHGKGTYKWPDGGEYIGDYFNNIKEGNGIFKWSNGKIYEGPFVGGKPHGDGILKINNNVYDVKFIEGKMKKKPSRATS